MGHIIETAGSTGLKDRHKERSESLGLERTK